MSTSTEAMTPGASPEQMLRQFHAARDIHGGLAPDAPTADVPGWVRDCRLAMLDEEVAELHEAMEAGDIVKIADALADITCVVVGTAVPYGIPFDAVLAEVCRSNMTKTNTTGKKLVKGPGYQPPRIAEILRDGSPPAGTDQRWDAVDGIPARDDPELAALMEAVRRLPRDSADTTIESVLRCAIGYQRTGNQEFLNRLAGSIIVTFRCRRDPADQAVLDAATGLRPSGDTVGVEEFLRERGL